MVLGGTKAILDFYNAPIATGTALLKQPQFAKQLARVDFKNILMGKVSKREIEKALLRAFQGGKDLEEVESELLLSGGSLKRLKKLKQKLEVEPSLIIEEEIT